MIVMSITVMTDKSILLKTGFVMLDCTDLLGPGIDFFRPFVKPEIRGYLPAEERLAVFRPSAAQLYMKR